MPTEIEVLWETLERTLAEIEGGGGRMDWETTVQTLQGAVLMLLDRPPEEVIARLDRSRLPARALFSWMIYEALKIETADQARLREFCACWNRKMAERHGAIMLPGTPQPHRPPS